MSDLYEQIASQRGGFENLIMRIPGFRGYLDKAQRRTADRMLRDFIAGELTTRIQRITAIETALLDNGGLQYMSETRSAKDKLQTFRDRVAAAAPGYSGFMASIKIDSEALDRLYAFDEAQLRYIDRLDEAIANLQAAADQNDGITAAVRALDQIAVEANEAFRLREDVLTNLSKSLE